MDDVPQSEFEQTENGNQTGDGDEQKNSDESQGSRNEADTYRAVRNGDDRSQQDDDSNELEDKMKGDAIGNTIYSERFVLNTLLKLTEPWNEELEDDLCQLWDMTEDSDVVKYLLDKNFIQLSLDVLNGTDEHRLVEILIGIVGNLCCTEQACNIVYSVENVQILLSLMNVTDTPLLIQLMRLCKALLYNLKSESDLLFTDDAITQINFFLYNSKNKELLLYSMQVVALIIEKNNSALLSVPFLDSVSEAFLQIFDKIEDDFLTHEDEKYVSAYLHVIQNASLILVDTSEENSQQIFSHVKSDVLMKNFYTILSLCDNTVVDESRLELLDFILFTISHFIISSQSSYNQRVLLQLLEVFSAALFSKIKLDTNTTEQIIKTYNYMINKCSKDELNKLQTIFQSWSEEKYTCVFKDCILARTTSIETSN